MEKISNLGFEYCIDQLLTISKDQKTLLNYKQLECLKILSIIVKNKFDESKVETMQLRYYIEIVSNIDKFRDYVDQKTKASADEYIYKTYNY